MDRDVAALADDTVATVFRESPSTAMLLGLDDIPAGLKDYSTEARDQLIAAYASVGERAATLLAERRATLDERDVLALDHIALSGANAARRLRLPRVEFAATSFPSAPVAELVAELPQLPLNTAARRDGYLECLRQIPRFLAQATQRHETGLSADQTPTARGVTNAITQIDAVLADEGCGGIHRESAEGGVAFIAAETELIDRDVRPSLTAYRTFLSSTMAPRGRSDEQCGLQWLPDGEAMYAAWSQHYTWSAARPEEIHQTGLDLIAKLREEFATLGERLWSTADFATIHDRILHDPALRFASSEEIRATAVAAVRRAEAEAGKWFGVVASTPCAVTPVPDALADGAAIAYYYSGALDGSRPGTYFVNTTKPTQRERHTAEAIAYHEAVPGHHFQLTIAQEMANSHLVFRVTRDVANSEGWGLYSERLAEEMGLYTSDVARLGMLSSDALRAARLVVDTGLHALSWSRQRAVDWMCANVPMAPIAITQEIDRYIVMPGQALAYMHGRLVIERCRADAAARIGPGFDLREFHDMVLRNGPVALPVFAAAVDRWIDSRSPAG